MSAADQRIILCEGYDDRAFLAGLLAREGARAYMDRPEPAVFGARQRPAGEYAYWREERFLRVRPGSDGDGGRAQLGKRLVATLAGNDRKVSRILVCFDSDHMTLEPHEPTQWLAGLASANPNLLQKSDEADVWTATRAGGVAKVEATCWQTSDASSPLPPKQTLERVVCAALARRWPEHALSVHEWISATPVGDSNDPKSYAYAHLAKWHAADGCTFFYERLWKDDAIAATLEEILRSSRTWSAIERFIG